MIIRGGNNIYATDVEAVLLEHPAVQEAAVVGVPHTVLGEDVARVRRAHARRARSTPTRCSRSAPSASPTTSGPRQLTFVDELPRNATGKVMKHLLAVPARTADGRPDALASPAVPDTGVIQEGTWHSPS